jgi:hypothetical protein
VNAQITTLKTRWCTRHQRRPWPALDKRFDRFMPRLVYHGIRDTRREESFVELTADDCRGWDPLRTDRDEPDVSTERLPRRCASQVEPHRAVGMVHAADKRTPLRRHCADDCRRALLSATPEGQSRDIPNLFLADGATFPFLPAKNITFTLMANAVRIAEAAI